MWSSYIDVLVKEPSASEIGVLGIPLSLVLGLGQCRYPNPVRMRIAKKMYIIFFFPHIV